MRDYKIVTVPCWVGLDKDTTEPTVFLHHPDCEPGLRIQAATITYAVDGKKRGRSGSGKYALKILAHYGANGLTDQECQTRSGIGPQTQIAARIWLEENGHVRWSGEYRLTRAKKRAKVWVSTGKDTCVSAKGQ